MKLIALSLIGAMAATAAGCATESNDQLLGGNWNNDSLAAGDNTQHHFQDPSTGDNGITDPAQVRSETAAVGSPEVIARLHSCSKITYASLGAILASRGVDTSNKKAGSTGALYVQGGSALGVANYGGRVAEAVIASTAALSKQFDIFVTAAQEIQANPALAMTACPQTQLVDMNGKFTRDALACLMGKPATDNHVTVANDAVMVAQQQGMTAAQGQQIAIASILEAAHTCE